MTVINKTELDLLGDHRHCDDVADDPKTPDVVRKYLTRARSPGHGMSSRDPYPKLFATYEGERVRVVMASRMGDVGITANVTREYGYDVRVFVDQLTDFADTP